MLVGLQGRKVMTNLDSLLTSKDITLPTKVHLVKPMVFPVIITTNKASGGDRIPVELFQIL